jgi:hypothetical protein
MNKNQIEMSQQERDWLAEPTGKETDTRTVRFEGLETEKMI